MKKFDPGYPGNFCRGVPEPPGASEEFEQQKVCAHVQFLPCPSFFFRNSLSFLLARIKNSLFFERFSRDFRGSVGINILVFYGGLSLSLEKQGKEGQGTSLNQINFILDLSGHVFHDAAAIRIQIRSMRCERPAQLQ